jgi:hypothetical protein
MMPTNGWEALRILEQQLIAQMEICRRKQENEVFVSYQRYWQGRIDAFEEAIAFCRSALTQAGENA